jgi:DHA2 family multidrug resistance protein-like MFS transporter
LTAGYATAFSKAIAGSPDAAQVSDQVQNELTKSFSSAANTAEQYPQYASEIIQAAKTSFVDGQDWAYVAGIVAIALGAALVFLLFPKRDAEEKLANEYAREDAEVGVPT